MIFETKRVIGCILYFACLIILAGCKSKETTFALSSDVTKYTSHSLDLSLVIGSEYNVISTVIKQREILLKVIRSDTSLFAGVDLLSGKLLFKKYDPSHDYISSTFDIDSGKIFSFSSLFPSEIFITNIKTGDMINKFVDFERESRPGRIILNHCQIFLLNDVWGVGLIGQDDFNKITFHNEGTIGLSNPQSSTMSFPVDSSLNLLSGHIIERNTMMLYAIDNMDSVKWRHIIKQNSENGVVSILNFSNLFVVKHDSVVVGLSKENGKEIWCKASNRSVSEIYKWHDKVLCYSLVNQKGVYPNNDNFEYRIEIKLFDCKTGKEQWSLETNSINVPHLGICHNRLLMSDNQSFKVFSLENGQQIEKILFSSKYRNKYAFDLVSDIITGDYYLKSYDGKLYW